MNEYKKTIKQITETKIRTSPVVFVFVISRIHLKDNTLELQSSRKQLYFSELNNFTYSDSPFFFHVCPRVGFEMFNPFYCLFLCFQVYEIPRN